MPAGPGDRYKWVALSNTTMAVFMSALDGSIVIIALPAIFRGIHLDPLAPGNISYLLWMVMGYRLVQAVLVVRAALASLLRGGRYVDPGVPEPRQSRPSTRVGR